MYAYFDFFFDFFFDLLVIQKCVIYAPNIGAPQYVRQILTRMNEEINNNIIIVGDFNTPLTPMDRSTNRKLTKKRKL